MAFGRLAGHIVETAGDWATHTLTTDKLEFPADHKWESYIPASKEAMLERYDKDVAAAKSHLASFPTGNWDGNWKSWPAARPGSTTPSTTCGANGWSIT